MMDSSIFDELEEEDHFIDQCWVHEILKKLTSIQLIDPDFSPQVYQVYTVDILASHGRKLLKGACNSNTPHTTVTKSWTI